MKRDNFLTAIINIILFLVTNQISFTQVNTEWVERYNGPSDSSDYALSNTVDHLGNVYVTGNSYGIGTSIDYLTIKYNSAGTQLWAQRYNAQGNSFDAVSSIAVDIADNVYVTGGSTGIESVTDYATIKYNSAGNQLWIARYDGTGHTFDFASSIAVDGSGNVYVTGYSFGSGSSADFATIKYNSSGIRQWAARYNGTGNSSDEAVSISVDSSGNVYVGGSSIGSGSNYDYVVIKYNSAGDSQWVARYNGPGNSSDNATSIQLDYSGNVYVTGESAGSGTYNDYATVKFNTNGIQQWVARYDGPGSGFDEATSISVDKYGAHVYITGYVADSLGSLDIGTLRYNSEGVLQWAATYSSAVDYSDDAAYSISSDDSGNVYVTGFGNVSLNNKDFVTIKYNSSGDSQWVAKYNGPANSSDAANSIALDGMGNVYVAGSSTGIGTGSDYATIKYSQSTGIVQVSSEVPEKFSLHQNYPNPFNPVTNLEFGISDLGFVSLKVYAILGKEVTTLVNEKLSPGKYKVEFDGSGLPSGIYFYRLTVGEFTDVKRMMIIK